MKSNLFILISIVLFLSGCLKKEYILAPPQLKLIVKDNSGNEISGATVKLYNSEENLLTEEQSIDFGLTDSLGVIVFVDLEETIYYFKIEKGEKNNLESNFYFKEPLKMGERKTIITSIF